MAGLIGNAPNYLNGVLSLLFVFVLPGLACASLFRIPDFPQRWFVIFLASLIANHLLVTLIAAFHLDPLLTYRVAACVVVAAPVLAAIIRRSTSEDRSVLYGSDIGWFLASLVTLAITYFNLWKHGVPNVFNGGDVLVSWNAWALSWAHGDFPTNSYGYPQLIPTLWAVTYIFTGSPAQYFAFYVYVGLIMLPILFNAMVLGRTSWWHPLVPGLTFVWFIAEIRTPWLRATLYEAFPDWVAAIFVSCGVALFVFNDSQGRFDREKIVNALLALCLVSLAAAIKPLHGLLALAMLAAVCADAWKDLKPADRNRFLIAAAALLSVPVILYAIYHVHLQNKGIPGFPVDSTLGQRLARAFDLFNSTFTLPFRIVFVLGLVLCPFASRLRWFALPLYIGIATWANTTAYDLRNVLSFLLIGAFVPLCMAARRWLDPKVVSPGRQWQVRDGFVAVVLAFATLGLTWQLAMSDQNLQRRFADDQLGIDAGAELNRKVGELLDRGCRVFTATASIFHIVAFAPFRSQMEFFFYSLPLDDSLIRRLNGSAGCTAIFYPPGITHPSIQNFVADYRQAHGLTKMIEGNGMELLVSKH